MKQIRGIWLPDSDSHFEAHLNNGPLFHGHATYQLHKLLRSLQFIPPYRRNFALDVGAHVGLWSLSMSDIFKFLWAYEPNDLYWQCWDMNMSGRNAKLRTWGLSEKSERLLIKDTSENSGMSHIDPNGDHKIWVQQLDREYHIPFPIDFIKLDCEGYEYFALKGAEQILRRDRPFVLVEQKRGNGARYGLSDTAAVTFLQELGGKVVFEIDGDYGVML